MEGMERYAVLVAALAGLAVTALSGLLLVPLLRRLKFGQTIKEIGPTWHSHKQGIPTMGGVMFILGSSIGVLVGYPLLTNVVTHTSDGGLGLLLVGMAAALAFGAIGFIDDFLKVVRKQNLGLRGWAKLGLQALVAVCFLASLHMMGRLSTIVRLPFLGQVEFGLLFYPFSLLLILGMVNAVNLTDGIDGLATSVTLVVTGAFLFLLSLFLQFELTIWAAALAGSCAGFLFWNFYPAKVIMGDTGALFLGGAVVALGYGMGRPDILIILGLVYIAEALSVVLQVGYFKLTKRFSKDHKGRRIFKMSPIHHHFEMSGWSEIKIDVVFSLAALVCAVLAYLYAYVFG